MLGEQKTTMKKLISILRWGTLMIVPLIALITAPIIYPLVYPFREISWVRWRKPLWFLFDDEDGFYGAEYWKKAKGITKDNFWTAYRWSALRNPMWNLHTIITPIKGEEVVVSAKGNLSQNGKPVSLSNVATLFFVDKEGNWSNNKGEFLSLKYSIIGKVLLWFKIKDKLYWRYSIVKPIYKSYWVEIQLGTGYRHTVRFKLKKVKIYA